MSLPGASGSGITPGFTSAGLPPSTTGLNEQEQAMVKMVSYPDGDGLEHEFGRKC